LYRTVFEPGYDSFPRHAQLLVIGALVLVLAAFILLMAPVRTTASSTAARNGSISTHTLYLRSSRNK
jgi:hypothetical protein